jgi:hypothetical protein
VATSLGTAHKVEVEAPDGAAALELEHTLSDLQPTAILRRGRWVVDLPGVHSVEAVEVYIRDWLRMIGTGATTMRVDGRSHTVVAGPYPRHRASHADFIG